MRKLHTALAALAAAITLGAQTPPPDITAARQLDLQSLSAAVRALRRSSAAGDEVMANADKLISQAQASGQSGEARRKMANAYVLLNGQPWGEKQEYEWSLALRRSDVVDSSLPFIAHLTQTYPASYKAPVGMKMHLSLLSRNKTAIREFGEFDLPSKDLIEQPFGFDASLDGVADGEYVLHIQLSGAGEVIATVTAPLYVVNGIATGWASIEGRLKRIQGHESAKATVRYPYVLAETINVGRRQLSTADFGLPFQAQPIYDFPKGVRTSIELLTSIEAGKDPLFRAKGDQERHYWFEEAREMMAYHVYAPTKWDGKSKLPMMLVLHGNTRDQDYYFDRDGHILAKMAEQHGYLVVCPMGYRPSAGWGSNSLNPRSPGAVEPARLKQGELSEKDALNVLALVTAEYPVDPARIYLFGHSAGGAGTWYLGAKYAEKWAGIATSAAATRPDGFPFERLKGMPIMVCHGDKDDEVSVTNSRNMVKAAKEHGLDPQYLEVPGATHLTVVALVEPKVFDFFDQHSRRN